MKQNTTLAATHTKPLTVKELLALKHIAFDDDNPITDIKDWDNAVLKIGKQVINTTSPAPTSTITLRLDDSVIDYFTAFSDYQERINAALLEYIASH